MERVRVAAVQSGVDPAWTPAEWANHFRWQLAACREARADLAVFPAWTGSYRESFPRGFPEDALGTLVRLLGDLAREAGLYLVPGSIPVRCADGVRLRSLLLAPSGDLVGTQDQLRPPAGFAPGRNLSVWPTALGNLGIIIAADSLAPEAGRILALQGAVLLCIPAALAAPYNPWRQIAGVWQVAQANQVAAVEACLVGEFHGQSFRGRSRVFGTVEMTADGSGILAEAASLSETEIVLGEVDLGLLARVRTAHPIFAQFNVDLYQAKMADAYRKLGTCQPQANAGDPPPPREAPGKPGSAQEAETDEPE